MNTSDNAKVLRARLSIARRDRVDQVRLPTAPEHYDAEKSAVWTEGFERGLLHARRMALIQILDAIPMLPSDQKVPLEALVERLSSSDPDVFEPVFGNLSDWQDQNPEAALESLQRIEDTL